MTTLLFNTHTPHHRLPLAASVWRLLRFLFYSPAFLLRFSPHFARWFVPGYHPEWDDSAKTVAAVSAELRATKGTGRVEGVDATPVLVFGPEGVSLRRAEVEVEGEGEGEGTEEREGEGREEGVEPTPSKL